MSEALLEAEGLTKTYRLARTQVAALQGVSVAVGEGEFVCVVGPPGAGKSTLVHLLGLLDVPTAGTLAVRGRDISDLSETERAGLRLLTIGFVFQFFNLLRELTAVENVMLPILIAGLDGHQARARAESLLGSVGLEDRMRHRPGELSGGQQQRVAVARALANGPAVVLADEPTGNLDSKTSAAIRKLFSDLNKEHGQALLVVSHEREWADVAGRVIRLRDGRVDES